MVDAQVCPCKLTTAADVLD